MRKIVIMVFLALAFIGCNKKNLEVASETSAAGSEASEYTVGIAKIIAHPALDAIEQGVIDELAAQGMTVKFDQQSANGEISTAGSIASKFHSDKVDVAVGIATPMALSLANTLKDTPVVFSAVTDPLDAGLRTTNEAEDTNITGVSDMVPIKEQIELMNSLKPLATLGFIYNAGEANSIATLAVLETVCKDMGIELIPTTVTNTSEVKQAAEMLGGKAVDAIYVSTDNVVAAAILSVTESAKRFSIPVIGADPVTAAGTGALVAYGVDYYTAGRQTGMIVADILRGTKPGDIAVKCMTAANELKLYVDDAVAAELGIDVSSLQEKL
ncbi:MAG: ABC transporter substrate-binding protein [Deferribacteraceae bacterium]|jgi:putative ABC transport system substrate-binding protein|nr:ABC transporter substrate-binding protein [Deferribacteraceae bacterium]